MDRRQRIHLLFCGHDQKFIMNFIHRCRLSPLYEVRVLEHKGHFISDEAAAEEALAWADVIFCEWALGNAVWFSHRKRPDQVLIVRLHAQEIRARDRKSFIWEIDWTNVNRLVLITHHLYEWMTCHFPALSSKSALIYNPVPFSELCRPKDTDVRFVLGLVGMVPAAKRLDLAVAVLRNLRERDSRYRLRVKGSLPSAYPWMAQRPEEMAWYNSVMADCQDLRDAGALIFDPHGSDMAGWYQGIGHILSVSDFEGSHQAVAEGMASGCIPAIRNWQGASKIYPPKFVRATTADLAELILHHSAAETFIGESEYCRSFAQERFEEGDVCARLEALIHQEIRANQRSVVKALSVAALRRHLPTIALVAYIPINSSSGYRIRVEQEIRILRQLGCIVHLICLYPLPKPAECDQSSSLVNYLRAHRQTLESHGAHVHLLEVFDFFRLDQEKSPFTDTAEKIADIVDRVQADVLHAEALFCARVCIGVKAIRPQLVFSIDWHGISPEEAEMGGAHSSRVAMLVSAESHLLAGSDLNIFVSKAMETHFCDKYGTQRESWVHVPCCVSDDKFVATEGAFRSAAFIEDDLVFGYAGSMADWQCGPKMMQLFAGLHRVDPRCRFLLLVPESDQTKALDFAARAQLPPEVFRLEEVSHAEVASRLQAVDVAVLIRADDPVNRVSSPTKYGEYLAAGLPVLMTDCIGDYSAHARKFGVGMVLPAGGLADVPGNLEKLRGIIGFVEQVRADRAAWQNRCQESIREGLSWESVARRWVRAYGFHSK